MNDLHAPMTSPPQSSFEPRLNRGHPWLRLALLLLAVGVTVVAAWWAMTRKDPDTGAPVLAPNEPKAEAPVAPPKAPVDVAAGNTALAQASNSLSSEAELAQWLGSPEALRRVVGAVHLVADGESPTPMLGVLKPKGEFTVDRVQDTLVISPTSYARYDGVARVIGSIDAAAVGRLYGQLWNTLQGAFEEIAPPGKRFDAAFGKAVDRLAAVPLRDEPLEVLERAQGVGYVFADPALEGIEAPEKHLLRMGPANARIVVRQLKAFQAAIARK